MKIMKTKALAFTVVVIFAAILAGSCSKETATNSNVSATASPMSDKKTFNSTGVIRGIDAKALKVTIDHEDIPGFMSAMEMEFPAANASVVEGFAVGDKVTFVVEKSGSKVVLASMAKVAGSAAAISGERMYSANCAECHGPKGEGAKKGIPLISGHALDHSEAEYVEQVTSGKEGKMPAFRDKLTPEQIKEVVRFVREEIQRSVDKSGKTKHDH